MNHKLNKFFKDFIFHLKENFLIRIIVFPYYAFVRNWQTKKYMSSWESDKIKKWKNKFKGQRCWVIGNGPSLNLKDVEQLSDEITFSSNRIYHLFNETKWRPDFYVAFEPEFSKSNADLISNIEVKKARFINLCAKKTELNLKNNYYINCTAKFSLKKLTTKNIEFSEDISKKVNDAYSVTFTILQIAFYMGFSEIYLLGVDHYEKSNISKSSHFYEDSTKEYRTPTYLEGIEYGYCLAKQVALNRGIKIYNATRGGNLEVFERVDFDSLFDNKNLNGEKTNE